MRILHNMTQLQDFPEPALKLFLQQRLSALIDPDDEQDQGHGYLVIVEPGDSDEAVMAATDYPLLQNWLDNAVFPDDNFIPSYDVIEDHGRCFELAVTLNDDGFTLVIMVLKQTGVDANILAMCQQFAIPSSRRFPFRIAG